MKHLILLLITCACPLQVLSFHQTIVQPDPVGFAISSATVNEGEQFCIDITLQNFIDMGTVAFDIKWNPYVYEYVSNSGFLIDADAFSQVVDINGAQGDLKVLWLADNLLTGQTELDSTVMVSICFEAKSSCGDMSFILFDEKNMIITDSYGENLPFETYPGQVTTTIIGFDVIFGICPDDSSSNGSIRLTMCGGQSPYIINYTGPGMAASDTINETNGSLLVSNLTADTYDFFIEDAQGDTLHRQLIVPVGAKYQLGPTLDPPTCSYSQDGKISLDIQPNAAYQIGWSTGQYATSEINILENGFYTVEVTDQNGCEVTDTFELHRPALDITFEITVGSNGTDSSALVAHVQGGRKPYVYRWESLPASLDSVIEPIESKLYRILVVDTLGCNANDSIDLTQLSTSLIYQESVHFKLSPVPASSFLTFSQRLDSSSKGGELIIFDVLGNSSVRQTFSGYETNVVLDLRGLPVSQYWLTVWESGKIVGIAAFQKN